MLPALRPGDEFVASDSIRAAIGQIVALPHPSRDDFWLVKRLASPPEPIPEDAAWVVSDNPQATTADSRSLGPVKAKSLWPMVRRLDTARFEEAVQLLASEDDDISRVVEDHGVPEFWSRPEGFSTLVMLIIEQQVSLESGAAVYARVARLCNGKVTPEGVIDTGEAGLRSVGTTAQKAGYIVGLARTILAGDLEVEALGDLSPDEASRRLTAVHGIGPWTADAYLLSALRHPDTFPVGDRALQVGVGEVVGMTAPPDPEELEIISTPWRPIRAAAARLVWHAYLVRRGRAEPAFPPR